MPRFNLAPKPTDLNPQWPPAGQSEIKGRPPTQAERNKSLEDRAGSVPVIGGALRAGAQLMNTLASPDVKVGIFTGPVNGISKLGNAIGDLVQRKPIDVRDAWTISDKTARAINPFRLGLGGEVTPADEAGLAIGEGIGAEIAGAATGATLLRAAANLRRVQQLAQAARQTQVVKSAAVAIKASPALTTATNVGKNVGQALVGTTLAAPFLDQQDGNLANVGDLAGLKLPGRVEADDNYLQALGKSVAVEGIAAPLALLGMGSFIKPIREGLAKGDLGVIGQIADAELEPYVPHLQKQYPALPPASSAPQLPGYTAQGGAIVPYDSAISRSLQEQTQIRQVVDQRQRLQDMGLVQQGEAGQLEFNLGGAVDPEIRLQVRQLQVQRGQLIKQGMESGEDITEGLGQIDQQIGDLIQSGRAMDPMDARAPYQPELDMPDGRPELDTYLANLDELSDKDLREIHSRVWRQDSEQRQLQEQQAVQQKVEGIQAQIAEIERRRQLGLDPAQPAKKGEALTGTGAKRLLTKAQQELAAAQAELQAIEGRARVPESLVGDQLQLRIDQQMQLDLSEPIELPPFEAVARGASEYGYRTPDDYRSALGGWTRDQLRRLSMPESNPEVAALVKARTGRRVWQAKKQDIIDALVEIAERRGQFLPPEAEQLSMSLTTNRAGVGDAPLFDQPADLSVGGVQKTLDADGNEVVVPMDDYSGRGMDAATREQLKAQILQRAIDNGEVQAPISPLPARPTTQFQQGSLVDQLFQDPTGQMALQFANDEVPTYKAGGKGADALVEEMRLRFEYLVLDNEAQRAAREAFMAEKGWATMTWEERKKLGILGEGFYSLQRTEFAGAADRLRPPTPQFTPDGQPLPPREPEPYRLTFKDGEAVVEQGPAPKPSKEKAAAAKKAEAAAAKATKAAANQQNQQLSKRAQELLKKREELLRQSQGAKC